MNVVFANQQTSAASPSDQDIRPQTAKCTTPSCSETWISFSHGFTGEKNMKNTILLVVEVKAFQWNVRPRWGRNFWKSVRCCVQLVFIMFVFSPTDGLSWVFHGYHADGCSYSLVFWEFCTSIVACSVVQDSYKHRRILGRCYNKCLWGKARMGSAYHFNLLMYFLALRIGTWCLPVISFWVYPLYSQRWKSWQLYTCLPSLRPFVSPLSPLCLPYSPFVSSSLSLLLPAAAAWLGFLFCSTAESSWA